MNISKELLSEVLGYEVLSFREAGDFIMYETSFSKAGINIYELAHKCKEWAFLEGFTVESKLDFFFPEYNNGCIARCYVSNKEEGVILREQSNTEPEVIFKATSYILDCKACQWILDNKEKGDG